mmetsp:Transcript_23278/g.78627  ORF Transcript_23278/g.78627 Transcript_23278/m.78627 type:complete len:246 (-) Transcript_23278:1141-1878(-)
MRTSLLAKYIPPPRAMASLPSTTESSKMTFGASCKNIPPPRSARLPRTATPLSNECAAQRLLRRRASKSSPPSASSAPSNVVAGASFRKKPPPARSARFECTEAPRTCTSASMTKNAPPRVASLCEKSPPSIKKSNAERSCSEYAAPASRDAVRSARPTSRLRKPPRSPATFPVARQSSSVSIPKSEKTAPPASTAVLFSNDDSARCVVPPEFDAPPCSVCRRKSQTAPPWNVATLRRKAEPRTA